MPARKILTVLLSGTVYPATAGIPTSVPTPAPTPADPPAAAKAIHSACNSSGAFVRCNVVWFAVGDGLRSLVVPRKKGDGVCFAVNNRPVQGTRGAYQVKMRHGVSRLTTGQRHTLGIIFHDAA